MKQTPPKGFEYIKDEIQDHIAFYWLFHPNERDRYSYHWKCCSI